MKFRILFGFALASSLLLAAPGSRFEYWPGATYDPAIPTEKAVLGYEAGDRITSPENVLKYMEALAASAPTRMKLYDYAKTWEGRRLVYAVVGSEQNIARLKEIQDGMQALADPRRTSASDARALMGKLPALVWLAYGVHGNEISSSDAALMTAYHLLASRNDKMTADILANDLIFIDPMQNPDGRARFVQNFDIAEGLKPDPSPLAAEHNEPWPGGRTNHYYFDMNRDWFALTQPETRGRIRILREWYPLVFVDLHEMGSDATYYFTPESQPYNPHLMKDQTDSLEWFGRNNAKWFDQYGFNYFTRENYDAFYPGYGASWPLFYGGVAMTYEQASTRGLIVRKSDDTINNYRDTVRQHFVSSLSTAETAAHYRPQLLENFYKYRQSAIEEGGKDKIREYILPRRGNVSAVDKLAANLVEQGVEVKRATAAFGSYPVGSYVIPMAQPAKRLVRTLLDPVTAMSDEFLKGEEHRRQIRIRSEIYDVTAWSVPLQYNIEAVPSGAVSVGSFEPVRSTATPPGVVHGSGDAKVAWLVPWGSSAAGRFLSGALQNGIRLSTTDRALTQGTNAFPAGTLIIRVSDNGPELAATVRRLSAESGADVFATDTGWVEQGVNFGSQHVYVMKEPAIMMAWDRPTGSSSAGQTRFVLERQFGYPVTVVRTQQLASGDLSRFQVIILPDAGFGEGYAGVLGPNAARRLKDWVQAGGTLIGLGAGAVSYLADPRSNLLASAQENTPREAPKPAAASAAPLVPGAVGAPPVDPRVPGKIFTSPADFEKSIQADAELPDSVHGALVRAKVNPEHWITAGVPETVYALYSGRAIFTPIKLDKGINAVYFAGPNEVLASGYLYDENRKQLAYKPFVMVQPDGRGNVIGFTADPNYRAYMDGLNVLFLNAVFRGPAHAR